MIYNRENSYGTLKIKVNREEKEGVERYKYCIEIECK